MFFWILGLVKFSTILPPRGHCGMGMGMCECARVWEKVRRKNVSAGVSFKTAWVNETRECVRAGVGVKESEREREREVKGTRKDWLPDRTKCVREKAKCMHGCERVLLRECVCVRVCRSERERVWYGLNLDGSFANGESSIDPSKLKMKEGQIKTFSSLSFSSFLKLRRKKTFCVFCLKLKGEGCRQKKNIFGSESKTGGLSYKMGDYTFVGASLIGTSLVVGLICLCLQAASISKPMPAAPGVPKLSRIHKLS